MKKIQKIDETIRFFKELKKTNKHKDYVLVDDIEVLKIVLKQKIDILYLLITENIEYKKETNELIEHLKTYAKETFLISTSIASTLMLKENHVGIFCAIRLPKCSMSDLGEFVVVLDRLEIPGNIGTIYRTLDACGASGVILVDPISKQNNPNMTISARGTNLILPTINCSYEEALNFLLNHNYTIYLGEPELGNDYKYYDYQNKIALVFGNERFGIQNDWYNHPHLKVYIPMRGHNNSLNVSIATSIIAYEAAMKRNFK